MSHPNMVYRGERLTGPGGQILGVTVVRVHGGGARPLSPIPSQRVRQHSPTGFEWGYGGSGPAQLALALCLDVTGDVDAAERCYQWFKWAVVSQWGDRWEITAADVLSWVERFEREADTPAVVVMPSAEVRTREGGAR